MCVCVCVCLGTAKTLKSLCTTLFYQTLQIMVPFYHFHSSSKILTNLFNTITNWTISLFKTTLKNSKHQILRFHWPLQHVFAHLHTTLFDTFSILVHSYPYGCMFIILIHLGRRIATHYQWWSINELIIYFVGITFHSNEKFEWYCNATWIELNWIELHSLELYSGRFRLNWREMGCKLVLKILTIYL